MSKKELTNPIEEELTANFLDMVQPFQLPAPEPIEDRLSNILARLFYLEETLASTREIMRLQAEQIRALRGQNK